MYPYPSCYGIISQFNPNPRSWIVNDLGYAVSVTVIGSDGNPATLTIPSQGSIRGTDTRPIIVKSINGNSTCTIYPKPGVHLISQICG